MTAHRQSAETVLVVQGVTERYTVVKHLRRHGRATAAHVWCSSCRWCQFGLWWSIIRDPASRDAVAILQQRVTALEDAQSDGSPS